MTDDPRAEGIRQLREQLEALRRWPIAPGDTHAMAWDKLAAMADLGLRIAELTLNR